MSADDPSMQRNPDLIRELLLELEEIDDPAPPNLCLDRDGGEDETKAAHAILAHEAGLVAWSGENHSYGSYQFVRIRLTGPGHDFLETIRSDSAWATVKNRASATGNLGIQVLVGIASGLAVESIKGALRPTGS